jgi:Alginate lyase
VKAKMFVAVSFVLLLSTFSLAENSPRVFSMNPTALKSLRERAATKGLADPALDQLRADADRTMKTPILSVTHKSILPPSKDRHDYMSQAPYFWPNPNTPNGLPYVNRDGERNPEINRIQDHKEFSELMSAVHTLALAYYIFDNETYANKATDLLRGWFIDPSTRMNPNLNYAQGIPGKNTGRGIGLIESRDLVKIVDAVGLLADSKTWTKSDQKAIETWCATFLDWMQHSDNGRAEARASNNHGSFYDAQIVSLALFTGDNSLAKSVLQSACEKRIQAQIDVDGGQPLELKRTKSMSYSVFNLTALFELATLGERAGVDLWNCQGTKGGGIHKALDFLAPFASGERKWTYQQIEPVDQREMTSLFVVAATKYGDEHDRDIAVKVNPAIVNTIEFALMKSEVRKETK